MGCIGSRAGWFRGIVALAFLAGCSSEPDGYTGRYALGDDLVLDVRVEEGLLRLHPSFWRTALVLDEVAPDTFVSLLHREIRFAFERDGAGAVTGVFVSGHRNGEIDGHARRLRDNDRRPVELLLDGQPDASLRLMQEEGSLSSDRAVDLGFNLIRNYPSRAASGARFLERATTMVEPTPDMFVTLGFARMLEGEREHAAAAFEEASALEPGDPMVVRALRHLRPGVVSAAPDTAWQLPFDVADLFRLPSSAEVDAVRADWRDRDLSPDSIVDVAHHVFTTPAVYLGTETVEYTVRVVSHDVDGDRHYGAILVPKDAAPGCCGVVVEAHGVDPEYSGVGLEDLEIPAVLGGDGGRAIIVVPSFRGEELRVGDATYVSGGDPRDAWDGATDDAMALLGVALATTPEADSTRICAFGKSRGGSVALLVAVRDPRIDCVVEWAGPADWFDHMGTFGFTLREQVEWALWERWLPGQGWGSAAQFIDRYLADTVAGKGEGVPSIRRKMLASSPLYFLESLPPAQLHHGSDDRSVPVANVMALQERHEALGSGTPLQAIVHDGSGHDQPYPEAYATSRSFLLDYLR